VAVACPLTVPLFPLWEPETERLPPSVTFTVTAYLGGDDPGTTLTLARMLPSGRAATWIVGPRRAAGAFRPGAGCDPATGALGCGCCWVCPFAFAAPGGGAGAGASFGGGVVARVVCDGAGGLTAGATVVPGGGFTTGGAFGDGGFGLGGAGAGCGACGASGGAAFFFDACGAGDGRGCFFAVGGAGGGAGLGLAIGGADVGAAF